MCHEFYWGGYQDQHLQGSRVVWVGGEVKNLCSPKGRANPTGNSEAGMDLQRCSKLVEGASLCILAVTNQSLNAGHLTEKEETVG